MSNTKRIVERLFYISLEDAETMMREPAVGREKYINETIVEQHGSITDIYVDFPLLYDDKGTLLKEEDPVMGTIERKMEDGKVVKVAVPENVPKNEKESTKEAQEIKEAEKIAEEHKRKRKTKGDKISEYEGSEGLLNNINNDYL